MKTTELHSIKPFRGEGDLGIIRLNHLAYPNDMVITIDGKVFKPRGFDTYGHPVIGRGVFEYYRSLKLLAEREGESLTAKVEYSIRPFCIKKELYDSFEGIKKVADVCDAKNVTEARKQVETFKQMLNRRKHAAFCGKELNTFVVYDQYVLAPDGHVYWIDSIKYKPLKDATAVVLSMEEIEELSYKNEVHLPGDNDTCSICGAKFKMRDIEEGIIYEDSKCRKVHEKCFFDSSKAKEHAKASEIIDAVYEGHPTSKVIFEKENNRRKYLFDTSEGTIALSFELREESSIILIEWQDNFRPFSMSIFDSIEAKKYGRSIDAWSKAEAISYLMKAKYA